MKRTDLHHADDVDSEIAVEQAMKVLKSAPQDPESHLLMAEVAEEKSSFDQALMWVNQGLRFAPAHPALLLKKASLLLDGFEDLEEAFQALLAIKQSFGARSLAELKNSYDGELLLDIFLLLADCYRLQNDFASAFVHASLASEISATDEAAILALATAYFELGDYERTLSMLENIEQRQEQSDFYWLLGQCRQARGEQIAADEAFSQANKIDRNRYHRPIRVSQSVFFSQFEQACLAMPKEIRDLLDKTNFEIKEIMSKEQLMSNKNHLSPLACIFINKTNAKHKIFLFQRNIENLAHKKGDLRDLIASALLHELDKLL